MDTQTVINVLGGLVAALSGWVLRSVTENIKSLQRADMDLTKKVQGMEVLVAGQYVKRDELDRLGAALFGKLDRIEAKLDGKADK